MKKNKKIALLIGSLWPFFYFFIFMLFIVFMVGSKNFGGPNPAYFLFIFPLHFFTIILGFALMVLYVINVFKNPMVVGDLKIIWVVLIMFFNILAIPVYWYLYIWRGPEDYTQPLPANIPNAAVPGNAAHVFPAGATVKYCPACGFQNSIEYNWCIKCGRMFENYIQRQAAPQSDYTLGGLIPYKNTNALIGYYFGVFSVIPFFPIGIAGFILGLRGRKFAKLHPEARGATHAWIGIIAGGFFGCAYLVLTILCIVYSTK
ncbi:MAG: hypothetical protein WCX65_11125 [bacterium]